MYTSALLLGSLGIIVLGVQIFFFLKDYSLVNNGTQVPKYLALNILGVLCSVVLIILGFIYFFIINKQV